MKNWEEIVPIRRFGIDYCQPRDRVCIHVMATTSKQYKGIGEDLWKGRAEKVVSRA